MHFLKTIGANAFRGCTQLYNIQFNNELERIYTQAFIDCTSLETIFIPSNVTKIDSSVFMDCTSLSKVTGGEGLTQISSQLFSGCEKLQSVNIGTNVNMIRGNAFNGCKSLVNIAIPDSVEYIASGAIPVYCPFITNQTSEIKYAGRWIVDCEETATEFDIKNNTIGICGSAFSNCNNLYEITLPQNIRYIGGRAFSGTPLLNQQQTEIKYVDKWVIYCDNTIVNATIKDDTIGICDYAFSDCTKMQSVSIPESTKYIGNYAFNGCTKISSIYIPKNVCQIGDYPFSMCNKLELIYLCENNYYIKEFMQKCYPDILFEFYSDTDDTPIVTTIPVTNAIVTTTTTETEVVTTEPSNTTTNSAVTTISDIPIITTTVPVSTTAKDVTTTQNTTTITATTTTAAETDVITTTTIPVTTQTSTTMDSVTTPVTTSTQPSTSQIQTENVFVTTENNGTIIILNYNDTASDIIIPVRIDGKIVSKVSDYALLSDIITSVTFDNPTCEIFDSATTINESAIIYGFWESTAHDYAIKYNREFVSLNGEPDYIQGDITGDGQINIYDAIDICKCIMGMKTLTSDEEKMADFDRNDVVDLYDAIGIAKKLLE